MSTRRLLLSPCLLGLVVVMAIVAVEAAKAKITTPVGISMREYRITVAKPSVRVGKVAFNITNFGEDDHDLRVSGPRGYSRVSAEVDPGGRLRFNTALRHAGTYTLICTIGDHAARGMKARLKVKAAKNS